MKKPTIFIINFLFLLLSLCVLLFFLMADESKKQSGSSQNQESLNQVEGVVPSILVRGFPTGNTNVAPSKTEWPEVVGLAADDAAKKIKDDMPSAVIQIVPPDCAVTMDFRTERVRLFTDSAGTVTSPARIG